MVVKRSTLGINQARTRSGMRFAAAMAIAPWAIVPVLALWILVGRSRDVINVATGDAYFFESLVKYLELVFQWSLVGIGFAYLATLVYGVPAYLILARINAGGFLALLVAGAIGGALFAALIGVKLTFGLMFVGCGMAVAAAFRVIASR